MNDVMMGVDMGVGESWTVVQVLPQHEPMRAYELQDESGHKVVCMVPTRLPPFEQQQAAEELASYVLHGSVKYS